MEFENLDISSGGVRFDAVKVKQIVFVQYQGEWIVVLQLVRAQVEPQPSVNEVYAYQYVSYPSKVAAQMSEEKAIVYVNTILRLICAVQRSYFLCLFKKPHTCHPERSARNVRGAKHQLLD